MIEAFRDNGLSTLDHNAEINVSRLETILSSIFYQLNKRLPTTHQINVDQSIGLLLNFMVATYDRCVVSEGDLFFSQGVPCGSMSLQTWWTVSHMHRAKSECLEDIGFDPKHCELPKEAAFKSL